MRPVLLFGIAFLLLNCSTVEERSARMKEAVSNKTFYQLADTPIYFAPDGTAYKRGYWFTSTVSKGKWRVSSNARLCSDHFGGCLSDVRVSSAGNLREDNKTIPSRYGDPENLAKINNAEAYCNIAKNATTAWSILVGGVNAAIGGTEQGARGYDAARKQSIPRAVNTAC